MELEEADVEEPCADCGEIVLEGLSPIYNFGEGEVLCWKCAIRRGGKYDSERDNWVEPPNTADLPAC
jgi:hypothetical protein